MNLPKPQKKKKSQPVPTVEKKESENSLSLEESSRNAPSANGSPDELNDQSREADQALDLQEVKELTDDELKKELKRFLIPKLRSASYRWKFRSDAIRNGRVARGLYKCASCGDESLKNGDFIVDHISPVVPLTGWDGKDWTQYINRMFCGADGFQLLCRTCADIKTDSEVQIRKMHREKKKANKLLDK